MSLPELGLTRNGLVTAVTAALAITFAAPGRAADFGLSGGYVLRTQSEWNVADPSLLFMPPKVQKWIEEDGEGTVDGHHLLLWAFVRSVATFGSVASLVGTLDTTALSLDLTGDAPFSATSSDSRLLSDGRSLEDSASDAAFIRELYVDVVAGAEDELLISAGKRRLLLLRGLVYDDYGLSGEIAWDIPTSRAGTWMVEAVALLPHRTLGQIDPELLVAGGRFGWSWRGTVSLEAGALWMRDRSALVPSMMRDMLAMELMASGRWGAGTTVLDRPYSGEADVVTLHAEAELDFGVAGAHFIAAFQVGSVTLENIEKGTLKTGRPAGTLFLVEAPVAPTTDLRIIPFLLRVSGARAGDWTEDRKLAPFVTLSPLVGRATLFLGGEVDPALSTQDFRVLGLGARGVSAAGIDVKWEPLSRLRLSHSTTVLGHAREGDGLASAEYGVELDTAAVVTTLDWLDVRAELDTLIPGEYFPDGQTMFRLLAGVEGVF